MDSFAKLINCTHFKTNNYTNVEIPINQIRPFNVFPPNTFKAHFLSANVASENFTLLTILILSQYRFHCELSIDGYFINKLGSNRNNCTYT